MVRNKFDAFVPEKKHVPHAFDIRILNGYTGIVIGILLENGDVDEVRMGAVRSLCSGISLTFHRAFDVSLNPTGALESIIKTGAHHQYFLLN